MTTKSVAATRTTALFVTSQFVASRLQVSAFMAVAALILGGRVWPQIWFGALTVCVFAQIELGRRWKLRSPTNTNALIQIRTALSVFDTSMYALAAALISQQGTVLAATFSTLIIVITMLYVLMHFYMQPRLMALLIFPCFASLIYCEYGEVAAEFRLGRPLVAAVPLMGIVFVVYSFVSTRKQLARARTKLLDARSAAAAREAEARAANQAKSEFLATMGHEIRTPLNGVLGIAQVMSGDELTPVQRTRLDIIRDSGTSLLSILNDLLDFSKIEAGKLELESVEFNLSDAVTGAHAAFTAAAAAKALTLRLDISSTAQGTFRGDAVRLKQVLYNLISNALKFTEHGEVIVHLIHHAGQVRLTVHDSGIGIAPDRVGALFEKFVQADSATTRLYGGTGLGLAIVHQLVDLMGGRMEVTSREGEGSTFTAIIPLEKLDACPSDAVEPALLPVKHCVERGITILAAEDNAINQLVLKTLLNQIGLDPHMVSDGEAAVAAWEGQTWDVILMDVQMPRMDGQTAARAIRRREIETGRARTPILALTANAMDHQRDEYLTSGMDDLISKPIEAAQLFAAIDAALTQAEDIGAVIAEG